MERDQFTKSIYAYSFADLNQEFQARGLTAASMVYNWYFKKGRREPCAEHNLPRATSEFLATLDFSLPRISRVLTSPDKTVKFLMALADGRTVETVLIPFQNKYTVCLSSQVGCAMKCAFCFTGTQGLARNLATEEIVGQFLIARAWLEKHRPDDCRVLNIVYMGQGEPLHNFEAVRDSAWIFISQHGLSVAPAKITISTSGYAPGLRRWKNEMPDVNIALSLHSVRGDVRDRLIPINRKFPLAEILPLVDAIPTGKKRFVTYEYLLIDELNDREVDAHEVGALLRGRKAYVNLIPFNPFPGSHFKRPEWPKVGRFQEILKKYLVPTTIRTTKGDEILAACGQLNSSPR